MNATSDVRNEVLSRVWNTIKEEEMERFGVRKTTKESDRGPLRKDATFPSILASSGRGRKLSIASPRQVPNQGSPEITFLN